MKRKVIAQSGPSYSLSLCSSQKCSVIISCAIWLRRLLFVSQCPQDASCEMLFPDQHMAHFGVMIRLCSCRRLGADKRQNAEKEFHKRLWESCGLPFLVGRPSHYPPSSSLSPCSLRSCCVQDRLMRRFPCFT